MRIFYTRRVLTAVYVLRISCGMEQLINYLRDRDLTQRRFAELIGVTQPTVHRWIAGTARPDWDTAAKIARVTWGSVPVDAWSTGHAHSSDIASEVSACDQNVGDREHDYNGGA